MAGTHTVLASRRTRLIERGIDIQIRSRRRVAADVEEARLIREVKHLSRLLLVRVERLEQIDGPENLDHEENDMDAMFICSRLEDETAAACRSRSGH